MAMQAPFADRATSAEPMNFANTFISYYTYGSVIGLNLDLTLRGRGLTLDGFMRHVWQKLGKPEIPYAVAGLEIALAEYTDDAAFARDFFDRYVRGGEVPDYKPLLAQAGMLLREINPGKAFFGLVNLDYDEEGATIASNTIIDSPLYEAGLDSGDRIEQLDGESLNSDDIWQKIKDRHQPGDTIDVMYHQRGERKTAQVTVVADPRLEVVPFEDAEMEVSEAQQQFRAAWLGGN
jgi:predicted metalloprotease with PDZ domain